VTGHAAVELPTHLTISFFDCQLPTLFVEVLQINFFEFWRLLLLWLGLFSWERV